MKFMVTFSIDPATRDEAIARFLKTEGKPPKGVKLLGRWICADSSGGFDLIESDSPGALAEFSLMWSDLLEMNIMPVVDDKEFLDALKSIEVGPVGEEK